jgi:hypothetical protein
MTASVEIIFDNSVRRFPTENDEVSITLGLIDSAVSFCFALGTGDVGAWKPCCRAENPNGVHVASASVV